MQNLEKTKIIGTIGPASESEEMLTKTNERRIKCSKNKTFLMEDMRKTERK